MAGKSSKALQATTTFFVGQRIVRRGQVVASNDEIVKGREHMFEDPNGRVEQATAGPGERRATSRRTSKGRKAAAENKGRKVTVDHEADEVTVEDEDGDS